MSKLNTVKTTNKTGETHLDYSNSDHYICICIGLTNNPKKQGCI